eukprot:TRINITY_DN1824_c0_g1_i13.p2 TRINITY_DN1824_c0_g1~~TRINITY_DN1824_c0_g1_i13.p2  ORF type:complete len:184 (-),score=40.08 TRINITY_DN1824_c0_g1_i13:666-1217(-)
MLSKLLRNAGTSATRFHRLELQRLPRLVASGSFCGRHFITSLTGGQRRQFLRWSRFFSDKADSSGNVGSSELGPGKVKPKESEGQAEEGKARAEDAKAKKVFASQAEGKVSMSSIERTWEKEDEYLSEEKEDIDYAALRRSQSKFSSFFNALFFGALFTYVVIYVLYKLGFTHKNIRTLFYDL